MEKPSTSIPEAITIEVIVDMKTSVLDIVDFHSHILPGVDHGSENFENSIKQLKNAKKFSIERILATSHFYPSTHTLSAFLSLRDSAAKRLNDARDSDMPVFKVGAEVLICEGLERFPGLEKLCFFGTNHLLIELPFFDFREEYAETVGILIKNGYNVILAHADRYPKEDIEIMLDYGVSNLQINADSLCSVIKKKHIINWFERGLVSMIGSDVHGSGRRAYKCFKKSHDKISDYIGQIKAKSDKIWDEISNIQ